MKENEIIHDELYPSPFRKKLIASVLAERRDLMRSGALQTAGEIDIIRKNATINLKNNISEM